MQTEGIFAGTFDIVKQLNWEDGTIISTHDNIYFPKLRLWNHIDDIRFPGATSYINPDESLCVDVHSGRLYAIKHSELYRNNVQLHIAAF